MQAAQKKYFFMSTYVYGYHGCLQNVVEVFDTNWVKLMRCKSKTRGDVDGLMTISFPLNDPTMVSYGAADWIAFQPLRVLVMPRGILLLKLNSLEEKGGAGAGAGMAGACRCFEGNEHDCYC